MDKMKLLISFKNEHEKNKKIEIFLNSVKQNGLELENISDTEQTFNICKEAVLQNGKAYQFVAPRFKSFKLWLVSKSNIFKFIL
jgi:hypothetical protein